MPADFPAATHDPACWRSTEIAADQSWTYYLTDDEAARLIGAVRAGAIDGRNLLDYAPRDFDLSAIPAAIQAAFGQALAGRGIALVRGLPRQGVSEAEFALLTWMIGLGIGVARPQGKETRYLSPVRDSGGAYRTATGRGYNSRSDLDFHVDDGDVVALTCYNGAKSGGESLAVSSCRAHEVMREERPDLLAELYRTFDYNMQGEEAPGDPPVKSRPIFAELGGTLFCNFNRNRIKAAQTRPDVRPLTDAQWAAMDYLDEVLRRPENLFAMTLEPGDMQILSNHSVLHSRTGFEDHAESDRKRLLFRLWLVPPAAPALPPVLRGFSGAVGAGTLRGGIPGHFHGEQARAYEARLAAFHGIALRDAA